MSKTFCIVLSISFLPALTFPASAQIDEGSEKHREQFLQLKNKFNTKSKDYYDKIKTLRFSTPDAQKKFFLENHPINSMVDEFLALEELSRGTRIGFSCLFHLVSSGSGVSDADFPVTKGKVEALKRLAKSYANYPDLDVVIRHLFVGARHPETLRFPREIIKTSKQRHLVGNSVFALAKQLAAESNYPAFAESQLALLDARSEQDKRNFEFFSNLKKQCQSIDVKEYRAEAGLLANLVKSTYEDVLEPPRPLSRTPSIVKVQRGKLLITDPPIRRKLLSEKLPNVHFELNHGIGQRAPDIHSPDAFGNPLKLSDHRNKVIVLMFSFKGCGPCEAMYPGNRKLIEKYKDNDEFVFLGVMGDDTLETVKTSVEDGTITWKVWWDGKEKNISNQWNVRGWPTTYVIDQKGTIRFSNVRGKQLAKAVETLLEE